MLVLCAARPEVLERAEGWPPERPGTATIELPALTEAETSSLLTALLSRAVMPADSRSSLLERTGGNPLYALEFARMVGEHVRGTSPADTAMPETVQAVISARLDAIPRELRSLVLDASVVGTSFWPGALAYLGDVDEGTIREGLEDLVRRGLVQPSPLSAFEGQPEFGFTHALIGEVAYLRIPRGRRARRHCSAGAWIARESGDRAEERAELLARHFSTAVELAEAAGEEEVVGFACGPAIQLARDGRRPGPTARRGRRVHAVRPRGAARHRGRLRSRRRAGALGADGAAQRPHPAGRGARAIRGVARDLPRGRGPPADR